MAIDQRTGDVHAVGVDAKNMLGRTPATSPRYARSRTASSPTSSHRGDAPLLHPARARSASRPARGHLGPSGVTEVEKRAVEEHAAAGAREAYLIEEPMAAAIGAGLPIGEPTGNMIVDIGGGTTEVAVISLGGIVSPVAAGRRRQMDERSSPTSRRSTSCSSASRRPRRSSSRSAPATGCPRRYRRRCAGATWSPACRRRCHLHRGVRRALDEPVSQIIDAIKSTLDKTPPELARTSWTAASCSPVGRLLKGLDERLRTRPRCRCISRRAAHCVAVVPDGASRSSRRSTVPSARGAAERLASLRNSSSEASA